MLTVSRVHGALVFWIGNAAPQIDHRVAAHRQADRGADLALVLRGSSRRPRRRARSPA